MRNDNTCILKRNTRKRNASWKRKLPCNSLKHTKQTCRTHTLNEIKRRRYKLEVYMFMTPNNESYDFVVRNDKTYTRECNLWKTKRLLKTEKHTTNDSFHAIHSIKQHLQTSFSQKQPKFVSRKSWVTSKPRSCRNRSFRGNDIATVTTNLSLALQSADLQHTTHYKLIYEAIECCWDIHCAIWRTTKLWLPT